jgi:hypothetical protein
VGDVVLSSTYILAATELMTHLVEVACLLHIFSIQGLRFQLGVIC